MKKITSSNNLVSLVFYASNHLRIVFNFLLFFLSSNHKRKSELFKRINRMHLKIKQFKYSTLRQLLIMNRIEVYPGKNIEVGVLDNTYNVSIPEVLIYQIKQCQPIVGSSAILIDDTVYFDDISHNSIYQRYLIDPILKIDDSTLILGFYKSQIIYLKKVILLDAFFLFNYYHFMFDSLARLHYINDHSLYLDYTICVSEDILRTPSLFQILVHTAMGRNIKVLQRYQMYQCDDVIYIEKSNYLPPLLGHDESLLKPELYRLHPESINYLKSTLETLYPVVENHGFSNRVVISRIQTDNARIEENLWFNELILKYDFKIYCPEAMNFNQQIALFRNAHIVVASTGAALVNVIFMQRSSTLVSINVNFRGFSQYKNIAIHRGVGFIETSTISELMDSIYSMDLLS